MSRGEFTRKFDREIMKDASVAADDLAALQALQDSERDTVEKELAKLMAILDHRAQWLQERFKGIDEVKAIDFRGRRFEFTKNSQSVGAGFLEFRCRLTDTSLGIMFECTMGVEGRFKKHYDYVVFPKESVNVERAKKFVESKIFEFAAAWQV